MQYHNRFQHPVIVNIRNADHTARRIVLAAGGGKLSDSDWDVVRKDTIVKAFVAEGNLSFEDDEMRAIYNTRRLDYEKRMRELHRDETEQMPEAHSDVSELTRMLAQQMEANAELSRRVEELLGHRASAAGQAPNPAAPAQDASDSPAPASGLPPAAPTPPAASPPPVPASAAPPPPPIG